MTDPARGCTWAELDHPAWDAYITYVETRAKRSQPLMPHFWLIWKTAWEKALTFSPQDQATLDTVKMEPIDLGD